MAERFRVGIDVGGTFTHAVAVNNDSLEVTAHQVVPTTHRSEQGVAAGIISAFAGLKAKLPAESEIVFLAHSTTQATNALLEGDVAKVGVLALAGGLEAVKVRSDVSIGNVELAPGKLLESVSAVLDSNKEDFTRELDAKLAEFKSQGVEAVVAAEGFSVDDPRGEQQVEEAAQKANLPACATHEMSGLYGLSARTQTAVFNASILPKMIGTALLTKKALDSQAVKAPLMVMRSDGGVMSLEEVKRRPVLTLLSGPAAGIAACLMFLKASDALFLEVGGTSTDICMIKDGKAAVKSASIGGRDTFLRTLDSRTLGVAGGSMLGWRNGLSAGPRSAHLAGCEYCSFAKPQYVENLQASDLTVKEIKPFAGDHAYFVVVTPQGKQYALTTTCAANLLGLVPEDNYSRGNFDFVEKAFEALAAYLRSKGHDSGKMQENCQKWRDKYNRFGAGRGRSEVGQAGLKLGSDISKAESSGSRATNSSEGAKPVSPAEGWAWAALEAAGNIIIPVLRKLISDYKMEGRQVKLIGGGGGCAAIVPFMATQMELPFELARKAEVISAIGAALAMVRESLERSIVNPTAADLQNLRTEAMEAVLKMGAEPDSVEVNIEVDAQKNLVRAVAQGSIAFSNQGINNKPVSETERLKTLAAAGIPGCIYKLLGSTGFYYLYEGTNERKVFFGLFRKQERTIFVTDRQGSVRLQCPGAALEKGKSQNLVALLDSALQEHTSYGDAGALLPSLYVIGGHKICDLTSLVSREQILDLAKSELGDLKEDEQVFVIVVAD